MKPPTPWERLAAAARRAPDERDVSAPYGFAARVAARAMAGPERPASLLAYFSLQTSLRTLGAAGLLAAVVVGANYGNLRRAFVDDAPLPAAALSSDLPAANAPASPSPAAAPASGDDPVAELVDIVS
jgi:hypothetical protein